MTESNGQLLKAALKYAEMGYPVFPCRPRSKTPLTKHGFKDATNNVAQIKAWWNKNPTANIGMVTGAASGLVVIDIDPRHGGEENFSDLRNRHEPIDETSEAHTGGGGRHLFFQHPGGNIPSKNGSLAPGVDLKADGGYVIVPPSLHPTGRSYEWELSSRITDVPPCHLPAWLLELIARGGTRNPHGPTSATVGENGGNPIPEGTRNSTLASLAGTMRRRGMGKTEIAAALYETNNQRCQPPLPASEVQSIAHKISRYASDQIQVALAENHWAQDQLHKERTETNDPGPLPDELLRVPGFVSEVMDYCLETAPYPNPVMAFCGALALQALLAGRKISDPGNNRTNIYLLGLGHSASGKDWPRKLNTKILHEISEADCLGDRFASGEGIEDAMTETPCMLFQTDEFDGMLQQINRSQEGRYENIMTTLLNMYSASNNIYHTRRKALHRGKKTIPSQIDQPCLVVFGTAIPNHYYAALSERMLTNGFFARMIILESGKRPEGQEPKIIDPPSSIIDKAKQWLELPDSKGNLAKQHPKPRAVLYTEDAAELLVETQREADGEYARAEENNDPVGTTVWGRVTEQIRKLSLIHAASEDINNLQITKAAVDWASRFIFHETKRMLYMAQSHVTDNPFDAMCLKAKDKLREAPGQKLPHSVLLKRMKIDAKHFRDLMETLIQRREVISGKNPSSGRTGIIYTLNENTFESEGENKQER